MTQYFLKWVEHKATDGGLAWIDKHIHGLVAVAAPWAGIPLADRALYSGCSTDVVDYLTGQHDLEKLQVVGVHPAIFSLTPVGARYYPDAVYRMCNEEGQYEAVDPVTVMEKNCPDAVNVFERYGTFAVAWHLTALWSPLFTVVIYLFSHPQISQGRSVHV